MGNGDSGNGNVKGGFPVGMAIAIVSLVISLDVPMFVWIQVNNTTIDKLGNRLDLHFEKQREADVASAYSDGKRDQLLADRGESIAKIEGALALVHADLLTSSEITRARQRDNEKIIHETDERLKAVERETYSRQRP